MVVNRMWHVAVAAMVIVLAVIVAVMADTSWQNAVGFAAIVLFGAAWALLARKALDGNRPALALIAAVAVIGFMGTAAVPSFAVVQFVAFPIAWVFSKNRRWALVANVIVALAVGAGFLVSLGTSPTALAEIAATVAISLAFSIAMGLWITQIATASEERQLLLDELTATQQQLAAASRDAGIVAERERLARDLHDTIAQDLTGLVMLAQRARREPDAATRDDLVGQIEAGAREALAETRALVASGSPTSLDGGLAAALSRLAERFGRETGIAVTFEHDGTPLDRDAEVVALRCTQEALANVRKHAAASAVAVTLRGGVLTITDDGSGFNATRATNGYGLSGMRDRLALAGGRLDVVSGASGTTLTIALGPQHAEVTK